MNITYDKAKSDKNRAERGLSFDMVAEMDFRAAFIAEDTRFVYPERRYIVAAPIEGRLHIAIITRAKGGIRVISFRKANSREIESYRINMG